MYFRVFIYNTTLYQNIFLGFKIVKKFQSVAIYKVWESIWKFLKPHLKKSNDFVFWFKCFFSFYGKWQMLCVKHKIWKSISLSLKRASFMIFCISFVLLKRQKHFWKSKNYGRKQIFKPKLATGLDSNSNKNFYRHTKRKCIQVLHPVVYIFGN